MLTLHKLTAILRVEISAPTFEVSIISDTAAMEE